ncbi:MAG: dUTP diphosphatase [Elusimicrobia bacterium]|nr:dUTP diphosphatase [Elusimicrobiota bacterium]
MPIMKLRRDATLPTRAHADDAGLDLYSVEEVEVEPGKGVHVKTGIAIELPAGTVGLIADRSSMARRGLKTAGGVIDAGYRGEIGVLLWNVSPAPHTIKAGDRIAQLLVVSVHTPAVREVVSLARSPRGEGGFGSTGR